MSNIKEVHGKPRLWVSFNRLSGLWPHVARLRRRRGRRGRGRRRRRRAHAPMSNTASHDKQW